MGSNVIGRRCGLLAGPPGLGEHGNHAMPQPGRPPPNLQLRGGSDEESLFGGEPVDDDDEETKASKRYAAAVAQLRKEGGECAALDEFEAESLKRWGRIGLAAPA